LHFNFRALDGARLEIVQVVPFWLGLVYFDQSNLAIKLLDDSWSCPLSGKLVVLVKMILDLDEDALAHVKGVRSRFGIVRFLLDDFGSD
jgi:hypothetical protein